MSWALIAYRWREPESVRARAHAFLTTRPADLGLYLAAGAALAGGVGSTSRSPSCPREPAPWLDVVGRRARRRRARASPRSCRSASGCRRRCTARARCRRCCTRRRWSPPGRTCCCGWCPLLDGHRLGRRRWWRGSARRRHCCSAWSRSRRPISSSCSPRRPARRSGSWCSPPGSAASPAGRCSWSRTPRRRACCSSPPARGSSARHQAARRAARRRPPSSRGRGQRSRSAPAPWPACHRCRLWVTQGRRARRGASAERPRALRRRVWPPRCVSAVYARRPCGSSGGPPPAAGRRHRRTRRRCGARPLVAVALAVRRCRAWRPLLAAGLGRASVVGSGALADASAPASGSSSCPRCSRSPPLRSTWRMRATGSARQRAASRRGSPGAGRASRWWSGRRCALARAARPLRRPRAGPRRRWRRPRATVRTRRGRWTGAASGSVDGVVARVAAGTRTLGRLARTPADRAAAPVLRPGRRGVRACWPPRRARRSR